MKFLFIILCIILLVVVLISYLRDRRSVKKKTVETIGKDLWREIDQERQEEIEKGKKFRKTLEDISKKEIDR